AGLLLGRLTFAGNGSHLDVRGLLAFAGNGTRLDARGFLALNLRLPRPGACLRPPWRRRALGRRRLRVQDLGGVGRRGGGLSTGAGGGLAATIKAAEQIPAPAGRRFLAVLLVKRGCRGGRRGGRRAVAPGRRR